MRGTILCLIAVALSISSVSAAWKDICLSRSPNNCPSIMMGVSCVDANLCAIVGGFGNTAESVYWSKDGFKTFNLAQMDQDSFLMLDIDLDQSSAGATAGLGLGNSTGILITSNVAEWTKIIDSNFIQGQDINAFGNGEFGFVGVTNAFLNTQGVLLSNNEGKSWSAGNWPAGASNFTDARYGSFPSDQVLYVTGGSWPSQKLFKHSETCLSLSHKTCVSVDKKWQEAVTRHNNLYEKDGGYTAALSKSTDGGKTWTIQYQDTGRFYFNDISCIDTTHCIAVAEGFSDGSQPGARIFQTVDGSTWKQIFMASGNGDSLMRVRMVSRTEAWAAGGNVQSGTAVGTFYHTVDGGKTWTLESSVPYVGDVTSFHLVSGNLGYAVGITEFQISTMMVYNA